jgi:hypothetical protein
MNPNAPIQNATEIFTTNETQAPTTKNPTPRVWLKCSGASFPSSNFDPSRRVPIYFHAMDKQGRPRVETYAYSYGKNRTQALARANEIITAVNELRAKGSVKA